MLTVQAGVPNSATPSSQVSDAKVAGQGAAVPEPKEAKKGESKQDESQEAISGAPKAEPKVVSREERIEYRDQDGNLLNEEQVAALEGKVEFQTKYETRTRIIDEAGNEVHEGVAPPHPDVEGADHETVKKDADEAVPLPPQDAAASQEGEKEAEQKQAKPASEGKEATVHDEL